MFDTEYVERQRLGAYRDDSIFADDAVLLASADQFSGKKKQGPFAAVD